MRRGVHGLSRLLSCEVAHKGAPPLFDPALIKADTDAVVLADSLVGSGEQHFSLCLQGPPGTGKSAFVRYLAERKGTRGDAEACLRPDVDVGGRDGA